MSQKISDVKLRAAIRLVLDAASEAFPGVPVCRLRLGLSPSGDALEIAGPNLTWHSISLDTPKGEA